MKVTTEEEIGLESETYRIICFLLQAGESKKTVDNLKGIAYN